MTVIILLFALGIALLAIEVIMPGGIVGTIGALLMFGGCVLSFAEFGTGGGMIAVACAVVLTIAAFFIEFVIIPRTAAGKRAFLQTAVTGKSSLFDEQAAALVGKLGEAVTMLSPSGYVLIDGQRFEAFCQSGQIPAGSSLKVVGADSFRLIVSPATPH
jgi:membrane-bound ClpP family serine protease